MSEKFYRVTEIISPYTGIEFVNKSILENACIRGTRVHDAIEQLLKGYRESLDDLDELYVRSFENFWFNNPIVAGNVPYELEKRFYCKELMITGQMDCIITLPGKTIVMDWKTSARESISWRLQSAAYRYLLEVNGYENVENVQFIKLHRQGREAIKYQYDDYSTSLEIFKDCIKLYKFFKMDKTRKNENHN